jgi:MYXO-CTERM domain-containing protein
MRRRWWLLVVQQIYPLAAPVATTAAAAAAAAVWLLVLGLLVKWRRRPLLLLRFRSKARRWHAARSRSSSLRWPGPICCAVGYSTATLITMIFTPCPKRCEQFLFGEGEPIFVY